MIYDEPLGDLNLGLPPLPPKNIQAAWYDQYGASFDAWLQAEIEKQLPASIYGNLTQQAYLYAKMNLYAIVASTLMMSQTQAVTRYKIGES